MHKAWLVLQVPPEMQRELFLQAKSYMAGKESSGTWTQFMQEKGFDFQSAASSLFGSKKT
jgi:hypothetical protein